MTNSAITAYIVAVISLSYAATVHVKSAGCKPSILTESQECVTHCYHDRYGRVTTCQKLCAPRGSRWQKA